MVDSPPLPSADVARVRLVLSRELETISQYEQLAREASDPTVRTFCLHLAEEEKEHVAEAFAVLRKLDAGQNAQLAKDFSTEHFAGGSPAKAPAAAGYLPEHLRLPAEAHQVLYALPAPLGSTSGQLTVGSLKPRDNR